MNGGNYRKWYGNLTEVVNWTDEAKKNMPHMEALLLTRRLILMVYHGMEFVATYMDFVSSLLVYRLAQVHQQLSITQILLHI